MNFTKYPSIENSYRQKEIDKWLEYHPEIENEEFVATAKLDGCNLSLWFYPDGEVKVAKRSQFIGTLAEDSVIHFQGVDIPKLFYSNELYREFITSFKNAAKYAKSTLTVYGELFGKGIQNRVYYGEDKYFRAFDIVEDGKFLSFEDFTGFMLGTFDKDYSQLIVPCIATFSSLEEALNFSPIFKSYLTPRGYDKPNFEEGVVIKPRYKVYQSPQGSMFYLKNKNPNFEDQKEKEKKIPVDSSLLELQIEFRKYLTENRLLDLFSKYGKIETPNQIGDYIRYMIEDARTDFNKDYNFSGDTKAEKIVFNGGSIVLEMLKKFL